MEAKQAHWSPRMILHTVYDAAGNAHKVEPVDAREYLAMGSYFSKPPKVADDGDSEPVPPEKVRAKPGQKPKLKD
jgi:hypothetical protein